MKTIILSIALLVAITTHAQVSINAGLSSRFSGVLKVAVEKPTGWNNTELSTMVSLDNYHPVIGLQSGFNTQFEGERTNYRLMIGCYYHSGILLVDKEVRCQQIRFGGSFRWQVVNTLFSIDYNGETASISIGYLLNRRK